jgi:thiamine-monophosphate kinase
MTIDGLGEFGRIRRFFAPLDGPGGLGLIDDAALVDCPPGHRLVVTVDQAVENVHYLLSDPADLVAKKLLRRNLSDLAAMGAVPKHYLLTTALPATRGDDWLELFASGLADDQKRYGVDLLGGDSTATSGPAVLTLTAIGEVAEGQQLRRSGAAPGDRIWVSGTIGDAFLGLQVLRGDLAGLDAADRAALTQRFQLPEPRTRLGPRLAWIASAMIDVSDGLLGDLGHLCEASQIGASVALDAIPLSPAARKLVAAEPTLSIRLVTAGDDYELLFAASQAADAAIAALSSELDLPITAIGAIEQGSGVRLVDAAGQPVPIASAGWRHF